MTKFKNYDVKKEKGHMDKIGVANFKFEFKFGATLHEESTTWEG